MQKNAFQIFVTDSKTGMLRVMVMPADFDSPPVMYENFISYVSV